MILIINIIMPVNDSLNGYKKQRDLRRQTYLLSMAQLLHGADESPGRTVHKANA